MEDAKFEDLLLKDNSWNVHENNIHMLLIEIYMMYSINNQSPPVMEDLQNVQLLKLPESSTFRSQDL